MLNVTFYNEQDGKFNATDKFDISSLKKGIGFFYSNKVSFSFNSDLSSLVEGDSMFYNASLTSFSSDLSSLIYGDGMFRSCANLNSFSSDLNSLVDGSNMFYGCSNLTSFSSDLSSLTNSSWMFNNCYYLASFSSDLSSLTNGPAMFRSCTNLTSFSSDLSSLTNGSGMFYNCSNLTVFESILPSLADGTNMFYQCKLNPTSIYYIVKSLPNNGTICNITLGIGVSSETTEDGKDTATQLLEFANEVGYNTWDDLKAAFIAKNWNATWQYGGTNTSITLSEDEQFRGIPVYARLIEEDKDKAEYCTEDGSKYYNLDWGHDVCDVTNYQYFGSLLEACGYYGIIPKQFLETE